MRSEQEVREGIILWAQRYYVTEIDDPTPDVNIVNLEYHANDDEWEAELEVSTSADNPHVMFWTDDDHQLVENWLHVIGVEY